MGILLHYFFPSRLLALRYISISFVVKFAKGLDDWMKLYMPNDTVPVLVVGGDLILSGACW